MNRVRFAAEIADELAAAINLQAERLATFGYDRAEVVENCLYFGITKTRELADRLETQVRDDQREARRIAAAGG